VTVSRLPALILVSCLLFVLSLLTVGAQETESFAFLVRQPERESSVPVLPANALPSISAIYATEESSVEVFVVPVEPSGEASEDLTVPSSASDWEETPCPGLPLDRFVPAGAGRTVLRASREEYSVYLAATAESDFPLCAFASSFVETFEFFLAELPGDLREGPPPEFPAVVEILRPEP
jgi:hypothetical protein